MNEYPTKFVSPLLGKRLLDFIHDEENNLKNSLYDLAEELHFFDELAEIYNAWLNQEHALLAGESKYYAFCSLARSNIYQACSSYCRQHFSTAMVGARIALDAALFAEMMAKGYLSEDDYLTSQKKRSGLSNTAKMKLKKGKKLGERVPQLLKAMSMLSEHGAHPSPPTWANRIITEDKGIFLSFFQEAIDSDHLKYQFLSILWFGGMALESFLHIGREVFQQDTDRWLLLLRDWKGRMEANKTKFGISPV
jgi:hypothetical protein